MTRPAQIFEPEYYARLKAVEESHWWTLGMTDLMDVLLEERLPRSARARFLDVGCGSGIGLAWAARRLPESTRFGVDVSPLALAHCRGHGAALGLGSAAALPFAADSIDLVLCLDVLQHLDDERPALHEVARVLRAGGVLFLRTNALSLAPPPPGSVLFTPERLERGLAGAGLAVELLSRANALGSLVAEPGLWRRQRAARGGTLGGHAGDHGPGGGYGGGLRIRPEARRGVVSALKRRLLREEGRWIRRGARLPFGHSLVCVARKPA